MPKEGKSKVSHREQFYRPRSGSEYDQRPRFHTPSGNRSLLREDDRPSSSNSFDSGHHWGQERSGASSRHYDYYNTAPAPRVIQGDDGRTHGSDPRYYSVHSTTTRSYEYARSGSNDLAEEPLSSLYSESRYLPQPKTSSFVPPAQSYGRMPPVRPARRFESFESFQEFGRGQALPSLHTVPVDRRPHFSGQRSSPMPTGAMSSESKGRVEQQPEHDHFGISPPPAEPIAEARYPSAPPAHVAPAHLPSPVLRQASHPKAWFVLDPPTPPRRRDLSPKSSQSYDLGFDDAMRAMENAWIGIGDSQYRHPFNVRPNFASSHSHGPPPPADNALAGPSTHRAHDPAPSSYQNHPSSLPHPYSSGPRSSSIPSRHEHARPPPSPYDYDNSRQSSEQYPTTPQGAPEPWYDPYYSPQHHTRQLGLGVGNGPGRSQRQLISCYPCRSRKLKCDGVKPCVQCVRRRTEPQCEYASHVRRRGKGKKAPEDDTDQSSEGREWSASMERERDKGSSDSTRHQPQSSWSGATSRSGRQKAQHASVLNDSPTEAKVENYRRENSLPDRDAEKRRPSRVKLEKEDLPEYD